MKNAVFKGILLVVIISLFTCSILLLYFLGEYLLSQTEKDMSMTLPVIDYSLDYNGDLKKQIDEINPLIIDDTTRITIIKKDGTIVADTSNEVNYNENHINREEIQKALSGKIGIKTRYSETLKKNLLYAAYMAKNNEYIIRLAVPYTGIMSYARIIIGTLAISILSSLIIAFFIAKKISAGITKPLNEISMELSKIYNDCEKPVFGEYKYDELNYIGKSAKTMSDRIEKSVEKLEYEKNKINYIIDNMSEGLVIVDENSEVMIINQTALGVLNAKKEHLHKNILNYTQNMDIINGIKKAIENNEESYFDIETNNRIYIVHIAITQKGIFDKKMQGVIILMVDVTAERTNQRIRQDFFSDASHELKTPITSIHGYAELLDNGQNYSEERRKDFTSRIKKEAENMTRLINDILMISRLESGTEAEEKSEVNIGFIIDEIIEMNRPMLENNNISLEKSIEENIIINADYKKIYQLIDNLISNGIRYNNPNGKLFITAKQTENRFYFTVKDTGIGIPYNEQNRVFERFYRVDKGRSRKIGGTGLGLSIVKHIVNFYNGNITLKSVPDEGTEITIYIVTQN